MKKGRKLLSLIMAVLMCFSCLIIPTQAASFTPRLTEPSTSSPYWIHTSYGGLNSCIVASGNSVLPNCVGYAWGRAYEILNRQPDLSRGNAGDWFAYNKNRYNNGTGGYPYSTDITKPKLGAIACWSEPNNAGHVAVVEQINGNQIVTSDSGWGYKRFWTTNRSTSSSTLSENGKIFQGYIYLLSDSDIIQEPTSIIYPTSGATFKIASGVGSDKYLAFALSNDNVQIFEDGDSNSDPAWVKSQYFTLTHVGDGWYTITNNGNGKAMDVDNWTPDPETNIHQYTLHNGDNQLFRFYDAGDGYSYIKSKLGCYVDVQNGDNVNRANVWTYTFNGTNAQKWKLIQKDVPKYEFDINIEINGNAHMGGFSEFTYDVYFNDVLARNDVTDCCEMVQIGTKWEIKDIKCPNGYVYVGGITSGTISGYVDARLRFEGAPTLNVNFVHFSASDCPDKKVVCGDVYGDLPIPQRPGFVFDGWYTALNGGTKVTSSTKVTATSNHTLYAHWKTQTVYFDVNHNGINVNLFRSINGKIIDGVTFDTNTQILSFDGSFGSWTTVLDIPFNVSENDWYCITANSLSGKVQDGDCIVFEAVDKDLNSMTYSIGRRIHYDVAHAGNGIYNGAWGIDKSACEIKYIKLFPWSGDGPFYCEDTKLQIKIEKGSTTEYSPAAQVINNGNSYGTLPTPTRTGYTFDGWYTSATGGTKITSASVVNVTGDQTLYAHWTCNHSATEVRNAKAATCTVVGFSGDTYCITCSAKIKSGTTIDKLSHPDTDNDKICDVCSEVLGTITPDTPEEPSKDCSCSCHKGGISGFFFKLILFFQRIFGMNKECKCGVMHY